MDLDICRMALSFNNSKENQNNNSTNVATSENGDAGAKTHKYKEDLESSILHGNSPASSKPSHRPVASDLPGAKILSFRATAPPAKLGTANRNSVLYSQSIAGAGKRRGVFRAIPSAPEKILDAPGMQEDFYLNLLDWGASGALAVALHDTVYLWNSTTGSIEQLCHTGSDEDYITSLSWSGNGQYLAVGLNSSAVQIWDAHKMTQLRSWTNHAARVGTLAWKGTTLSTGSRDTRIHNNDVRIANPHYATLAAHTQEVCGLKWSPNGTQLASGGNDNLVCIWDNQSQTAQWAPRFQLDHHNAAVKAMAWCPLQANLLATGGGTADRHLRFWNTANGSCVKAVDTKSQVSGIQWSQHNMELVTSHGFSQNQLTVWKYSSLARMAELKGHSQRILHPAQSPDGSTVVSGGADETLRFWKVFDASDAGRRGSSAVSRKGDCLTRHQSRLNIR